MPRGILSEYERHRIAHAMNYDLLVLKVKAEDYIVGLANLSDKEYQEALEYYVSTEEYEICHKLVTERNGRLRRISV